MGGSKKGSEPSTGARRKPCACLYRRRAQVGFGVCQNSQGTSCSSTAASAQRNARRRAAKRMKVLLVEPAYYTQYPPLGLLKLSKLYKYQGHEVRLVRGHALVSCIVTTELYINMLFT